MTYSKCTLMNLLNVEFSKWNQGTNIEMDIALALPNFMS